MTRGDRNHINLNRFFHKLTMQKIDAHFMTRREGDHDLESLKNGYLQSYEYLQQRFQIEQRRAERTNYEFALVVIELNDEKNSLQPVEDEALKKERAELLFSILKIILRATDVVVKFCNRKFILLLPDTDRVGTESVIVRIKKNLTEILEQSFGVTFQDTRIYGYVYPGQMDEIDNLTNPKISNDRRSAIELEQKFKKMQPAYSQADKNAGFSTKAKFRASSRYAAALENPLWVLKKALFDCSWDWEKFIKRSLDIVISLLAMIFLSPLIVLISILIKISSPGPVFFKQERIGFRGKRFTIYKFRTMRLRSDDQIHKDYIRDFIHNSVKSESGPDSGNPVFKIKNDPRVTSIGKLLRRTSLDEIAQFLNVLKGEMSLIGPRPAIPYEVAMYDQWHKRRFLAIKPGLTGLWQIYGRNTITFDEMVRLDLAYANNWSLTLDIKILLKTIWAVVSMKGAY